MPKKLLQVELLADESPKEWSEGRVLRMRRLKVRNAYQGGEVSRDYGVELAQHRGHDAVAVIPYWIEDDTYKIMLLRSFRPALLFRDFQPESEPFLVECVAGVLEAGEGDGPGIRHRAARETLEEAGFRLEENDVQILGVPFYASPGVYTEKIWITTGQVDPRQRVEPLLDGSVFEEVIEPLPLALDVALEWLERGLIRDAKTEIALMRFAHWLGVA